MTMVNSGLKGLNRGIVEHGPDCLPNLPICLLGFSSCMAATSREVFHTHAEKNHVISQTSAKSDYFKLILGNYWFNMAVSK